MCIVIDINALSGVFEKGSTNFKDFEPIRKWVLKGKGFIVYGGTKYKEELKKASKYLKLLSELKKRKLVEVDGQLVDDNEQMANDLANDPHLDDAHIIAIFRVSECRLFCSLDKRADTFVKKEKLYPKGQKPPSIYKSRKNSNLLCDKYIVEIKNRI
ncbi:hypothetical protein MCHI_001578 [Candidatus Magnetoovum chiemensis]|nr:hypothetical protein MCHI_001578 [Candidatus Magnetoovum chiemensis]